MKESLVFTPKGFHTKAQGRASRTLGNPSLPRRGFIPKPRVALRAPWETCLYPEGVSYQSPESRFAHPGKLVFTPKGFHTKAQGRASRTLGKLSQNVFTPTGFHHASITRADPLFLPSSWKKEKESLVFTPKGFHTKAQGRASRTLGKLSQNRSLPQRGYIMPQSLAQIYLHIVFSTKDRRPMLADPTIRDEMHKFLGGACNKLDCPVLRVGGVSDHVHILCRFGRTISVSDLVKELKRESSQWVKTNGPDLRDFYWQAGYGAFSISPSHVEIVRDYIGNQEAHHQNESFQDEFRRLLTKYNLEWDERYVWD
jgi:putative transposase